MTENPAPRKKAVDGFRSAARDVYMKLCWPSGVPSIEMVKHMNEMDGTPITEVRQLSDYAFEIGLRRPAWYRSPQHTAMTEAEKQQALRENRDWSAERPASLPLYNPGSLLPLKRPKDGDMSVAAAIMARHEADLGFADASQKVVDEWALHNGASGPLAHVNAKRVKVGLPPFRVVR